MHLNPVLYDFFSFFLCYLSFYRTICVFFRSNKIIYGASTNTNK